MGCGLSIRFMGLIIVVKMTIFGDVIMGWGPTYGFSRGGRVVGPSKTQNESPNPSTLPISV